MFADVGADQIAVMIPIVFILGGIALIIVAINAAGRKKDLEHKERLIAMEKGLPLPEPPEKDTRPVHSTRRAWGLIWVGLGLALTIALAVNPDSADVGAWAWGLVPLFIGAGLLVASVLDKKEFEQRRHEDKAGPPVPHA